MSKKILLLVLVLTLSAGFGKLNTGYAKEISYTQDDRDRLIRVETKLEEGLKAVNQRIDVVNQRIDEGLAIVNQRIDDLRELIYLVLGGIFVLIGFVIWDRRTALQPAIRKTKELEEREEIIEKVIKELARKDPDVANVLKQAGRL